MYIGYCDKYFCFSRNYIITNSKAEQEYITYKCVKVFKFILHIFFVLVLIPYRARVIPSISVKAPRFSIRQDGGREVGVTYSFRV